MTAPKSVRFRGNADDDTAWRQFFVAALVGSSGYGDSHEKETRFAALKADAALVEWKKRLDP